MKLSDLNPFPKKGLIRVIVETPKGSRNKIDYDPELEAFCLNKTLGAGMTFPFDFGFIPSTKGEDGDPLDAMVLMPESLPPGCIIQGRLIGVMLGRQREGKKTIQNDRYLVVSETAEEFSHIQHIDDVPKALLDEVEMFFVTYNRLQGRVFKLAGTKGPKAAEKKIREQFAEP